MVAKKTETEGALRTFRCPVCSREFQSDMESATCTGAGTVEERDGRRLRVTKVMSEDGETVFAEVKHYKKEHGVVWMEVSS